METGKYTMWKLVDPFTLQRTEVKSIKDLPKDILGFVYLIEYEDGTKYIGKKNVFSLTKVKSLKSGKEREGTVGKTYRNTGKGFRQCFDIIKKETDWFTYCGSHKTKLSRKIKAKYILDFAYTKIQLTYLEAKYMFKYGYWKILHI